MPALVSKKSIFNTIIYKPRGVARQQTSRTLLENYIHIGNSNNYWRNIFQYEMKNQFCQNIDPTALLLQTFYVTPDSSILQGLQGLKVKKINNLCIKLILPLTLNQNGKNYLQSEAGNIGERFIFRLQMRTKVNSICIPTNIKMVRPEIF